MFASWRGVANRSTTASVPYVRMAFQLSGRAETIVSVRKVRSRSVISPVLSSASAGERRPAVARLADELVDQRVQLVDGDDRGAGEGEQPGQLGDQQPGHAAGGVDP